MTNKNRFLEAALFLLIIGVTGCSYDDELEPPLNVEVPPVTNPTPVAPLKLPSSPRFFLKLNATPEPDRYSVEVSWEGTPSARPKLVQRVGGEATDIFKTADFPQSRFVDKSIVSGTTYKYVLQLDVDAESGIPSVFTQSVTIPKDRIVHQASDLRVKGVGRLYLEKNRVVQLSEPLHLSVDEIISDGATIELKPLSPKAEPGKHGAAAPSLRIFAKRGRGSLRIVTRGQHGGEGPEGATGRSGNAGRPGTPGDWTIHPNWSRHSTSGSAHFINHSRENYLFKRDERWWGQTIAPGVPAFVCRVQPTDGEQGETGAPGQDGEQGGKGGDTSEIYLYADEGDLLVDLVQEPGNGAIGGRGGEGGTGGPGGPPGAIDSGFRCTPAKQGAKGPAGLPGRQGRQGGEGSKAAFCVKVAGKEVGDCTEAQQKREESARNP